MLNIREVLTNDNSTIHVYPDRTFTQLMRPLLVLLTSLLVFSCKKEEMIHPVSDVNSESIASHVYPYLGTYSGVRYKDITDIYCTGAECEDCYETHYYDTSNVVVTVSSLGGSLIQVEDNLNGNSNNTFILNPSLIFDSYHPDVPPDAGCMYCVSEYLIDFTDSPAFIIETDAGGGDMCYFYSTTCTFILSKD